MLIGAALTLALVSLVVVILALVVCGVIVRQKSRVHATLEAQWQEKEDRVGSRQGEL